MADQNEGFDPKNMDMSVSAGEDFNRYANGKWLDANPVPSEYTRWGLWEQLGEKNNLILREVMEEATSKTSGNGKKVGDFWRSAMNEEGLDQSNGKELTPLIEKIEGINDVEGLVKVIAYLQAQGLAHVFSLETEADMQNSERNIAWIDQAGIGLPDRDHYFLEDKAELRVKYEEHVANTLVLTGLDSEAAKNGARIVMTMETEMAKNSLTRVERRNPANIYHLMDLAQLAEAAPAFPWALCLGEMGAADPGPINVMHPQYCKAIAEMLNSVELANWKVYLRWHVAHAASAYLSKPFVDEQFNFYGKTLNGQDENKPRWKRVLRWADQLLGEMLGEVYCEKKFPPEAKKAAVAIVEELRDTLRDRLQTLEWMGEETKKRALKKLESFGVKIGYPDKWIDYSTLEIDDGPLLFNVMRANEFELKRNIARMNKPIDLERWEMPPQTINAYYHPLRNEICFPAAILQFPMFSPSADPAMNFGAMGAIVSHEITHGYDDQGRKFDEKGNMVDWWSPEDAANFESRAKKMVDVFSRFTSFGKNINGELTQGENIADLGGLKLAFAALQKHLSRHGRPDDIDGFSQEQRFFLSWAQIWRTNIREKAALERIITDPHAPGEVRINGPLAQIPAFHEAFGVKAGEKMFLAEEDRAEIW